MRFHDLRHTAVALAIAEDAHPEAIQARMGHASVQMTLDRYGHLFPELDETIAERLDATHLRLVKDDEESLSASARTETRTTSRTQTCTRRREIGVLGGRPRVSAGLVETGADLRICWRRRAESNRRTGLCRPLPKPLGHAAVVGSW